MNINQRLDNIASNLPKPVVTSLFSNVTDEELDKVLDELYTNQPRAKQWTLAQFDEFDEEIQAL